MWLPPDGAEFQMKTVFSCVGEKKNKKKPSAPAAVEPVVHIRLITLDRTWRVSARKKKKKKMPTASLKYNSCTPHEKVKTRQLKYFVPLRDVFLVWWHYGCKDHYNETLFLLEKNYTSPQVRVRLCRLLPSWNALDHYYRHGSHFGGSQRGVTFQQSYWLPVTWATVWDSDHSVSAQKLNRSAETVIAN